MLHQSMKLRVAEACVGIHDDVTSATTMFWEELRRRYYTTPSSYMELIKTYTMMLEQNKAEFVNNRLVYCLLILLTNCLNRLICLVDVISYFGKIWLFKYKHGFKDFFIFFMNAFPEIDC